MTLDLPLGEAGVGGGRVFKGGGWGGGGGGGGGGGALKISLISDVFRM